MSKYHCPCGWVISDTTFPCSSESHVISDADLDAITDYSVEPTTIDADRFDGHERELLECSQCGRLHYQKAPGVNEYVTYVKDVDGEAHVVKLEAVIAKILLTYPTEPGYVAARLEAEKLLRRE